MPIRFRCSMCRGGLSIARRKAGMQVECPKCGYEVTVPEEDAVPAPIPAPAPVSAKAKPMRHPAPDHPLFEHSDFDRLLDAKVKQSAAPARTSDSVSEPKVARSAAVPTDEGIHIGRGMLMLVAGVATSLVVAAFILGFLVGR